MAIKLLALDLDGTVVRSDLTVADEVKLAINRAMIEKNVKVVVATGRMHQSAMPFAKILETPQPVVSYQGGMIREQNSNSTAPIFHKPIDINTARPVIEFLLENGIDTNLYINDVLYVDPSNSFASEYARLAGIIPTVVDDITQQLTDAPTKIVAITEDKITHITEELNRRYSDTLGICLSRYNFCEMINPATSKWHAVEFLAKQNGIDASEVMCIGDQENDLQMLQHAGLGVAMGNAPEHVKAQASVVTDSIHDHGVKTAIEKYIFDGETV